MSELRPHIDTILARRLIAEQFPQWAELPIKPVEPGGWDNRTFRLGPDMTVRLPSAEGYVPQVEKEHRWLPKLAPKLPLPIPTPLAKGHASPLFPFPWSVYRWVAGEPATTAQVNDRTRFAADLAQFLAALQRIEAHDGPPAGPHSFYRGGPLSVYDAETRGALADLEGKINTRTVAEVWEAALATRWQGAPVWVHGDVAAGNLLLRNGHLCAVIDFGCCAVGDPACDLVVAWTFLGGEGREAFRGGLKLDEGTWARGRGWALWKALIVLAEHVQTNAQNAAQARRVIEEVIADHHSQI